MLAQVGWRTAFARNWDEGVALDQRAIDRSIEAPGWYHLVRSFDRYRRGDYEGALADVDAMSGSNWVWDPLMLAAVEGQLGNKGEAQQALDRASALSPGVLHDPRAAMRVRNLPQPVIDKVIDGLRKAGLGFHTASKAQ